MSQNQQDPKDRKIADLRSLLLQAKTKIQQYKTQLVQKQKDTQQLKKQYDKKIRVLEGDSENIIKQYEQRLLRYQKTLEDSNQLVQKNQKGLQQASKYYEELLKKIASIYTVTNKIFYLTPSKDKDSSDAVEQLVQIQKCKEFMDSMQKFSDISDLQYISKILTLLVKNNQMSLNKRREQRLQFVKKQTIMQKNLENQKQNNKTLQSEINLLRKQLDQSKQKYERNIESIAKSKAKMQQQKTNDEFVKQLLLKLLVGPKDASTMAFGILCKVLKFTADEAKLCEKKIK